MTIQRLWNIVPILERKIPFSFNAEVTQIALDAFDVYSTTRSSGSSFGTKSNSGNRRTRRRGKPSESPSAQPDGSGLTSNDFFFEHQRISGYTNGTPILSQSGAIQSLQDALALQVKQYLRLLGGRAAEVSTLIESGILSLDMWAAIQRGKEAYHKEHVHEGALVSGVYYSSVPEGSAPLVLHEPTKLDDGSFGYDSFKKSDDVFVITPQDGKVVLFPPWLLHGVPRVKVDDADRERPDADAQLPRVSFAFNLSGAFAGGDPWDITR